MIDLSPFDRLERRTVRGYGWRPDLPDQRDLVAPDPDGAAAAGQPPVFSLRQKFPSVYDQGQLGSCTGNGIAGAFDAERMRQGLQEWAPSRLFIYYGERVIEGTVGQDAGGMIRDGFKVIANLGAPPETDWPYDISRFTEKPPDQAYADALNHQALQYARVKRAQSSFKAQIAAGLGVVIGFSVYQSFESASVAQTGLMPYPAPNESVLGGHCVVAIGWDDTKQLPGGIVGALECRNSWGAGWGDQGHFWMPWKVITNSGMSSDFWVCKLVEG